MSCRDELLEALRERERIEARVAALVGELDASGEFGLDGAVHAKQWLEVHGGLARDDAGRLLHLARALRELPVTAACHADGTLTLGQVRAITAAMPVEARPLFARDERELLPTLASLNPRQIGRAMHHWWERAQAELTDSPPQEPSGFFHNPLPDGRYRSDGNFEGEPGGVIDAAIQVAITDDLDGEPVRTLAERRADALVEICRFYLAHHEQPPSGHRPPQLIATFDWDQMMAGAGGELLDGTPVSSATIKRMLCDAKLHRYLHRESSILDYGRGARTAPLPLRTAVIVRDQHCRFPGCDRRHQWGDIHHVQPWEEIGETNPQNMVLLCSRHHHLLHQPGWHNQLTPDGTFVITTPEGRTLTSRPPPRAACRR